MRLKIDADLRNAYNPPCNRSNAFSKKVENHACAVALHAMYYNFVRIDQTLKVRQRWLLVSDRLWEISDVVNLLEAFAADYASDGGKGDRTTLGDW